MTSHSVRILLLVICKFHCQEYLNRALFGIVIMKRALVQFLCLEVKNFNGLGQLAERVVAEAMLNSTGQLVAVRNQPAQPKSTKFSVLPTVVTAWWRHQEEGPGAKESPDWKCWVKWHDYWQQIKQQSADSIQRSVSTAVVLAERAEQAKNRNRIMMLS